MSFVVCSQPRHPGTEWARQQIFGADTSTSLPVAGFRETVAQAVDVATARLNATLVDARVEEGEDDLSAVVSEVRGAASALAAVRERLVGRDVERPFRVVLMGRTMAGKSTLFEYLTGGTGSRIGVGAQRTTRHTSVQGVRELPGVEIVDTPGVGAMDGQDDYNAAFAEVADADLILWVATDQATQEQTGSALRRLADLGKPILVALNCLADIRDELNYVDLLEEPERIFGGDTQTNLAPIRRQLASSGGSYLDALMVHAQAAHLAASGAYPAEDATQLLDRSRIHALFDAIRRQRDNTAQARRYVSLADAVRYELLEASKAVEEACTSLRHRAAVTRGARDAYVRRARRRVEDADSELEAAFAASVTARERWIEQVDVEQTEDQINEAWKRELETLQGELETSASEVAARLEADLKGLAADISEDWSSLDTDGFRDLGGLGGVWGNRAVKIGGRVASVMGGAAGGAKVGALIGTAIAPGAGTAVGATVGTVIGGIVGNFGGATASDWLADRLFRSHSKIRQRRRQRVHDQLAPILGELSGKVDVARSTLRTKWLAVVDAETARQTAAAEEIDAILASFACLGTEVLGPAVTSIDTELVRELLRQSGRDRTAASLMRATRWRGAGAAVELPGEAFAETLLFPLADDVERIVPTRTGMAPSTGALQIIRSLTDRPVTVHQMTHHELTLALDSPVTPGVRKAWEAVAMVHTGAAARIEETVEGDIG